jgi:hypothetical protein
LLQANSKKTSARRARGFHLLMQMSVLDGIPISNGDRIALPASLSIRVTPNFAYLQYTRTTMRYDNKANDPIGQYAIALEQAPRGSQLR